MFVANISSVHLFSPKGAVCRPFGTERYDGVHAATNMPLLRSLTWMKSEVACYDR